MQNTKCTHGTFKILSADEYKKIIKRQLDLVKQNQELTKEVEFRDYRVSRLEQEIRDLKTAMLKYHKQHNEYSSKLKMTYEKINIYS